MTLRILTVPSNGGIPNHPRWPALVLPGVLPADIGIVTAKARIAGAGWTGLWDWTVFDYHHFHPDGHEALVCIAGRAPIRLGGEAGEDVAVAPGDGLILPAGFGHRRVDGSSGFRVVGAYPPGQADVTVLRAGDPFDAAALAALPRPERDPFTGDVFPGVWSDAAPAS